MKRLLLLLLFIVGGTSMYGQNLWYAQPGDTFAVYAEKAYIRQSPAGTITDSLATGDMVVITAETDKQLTMKGITAPWKEISYKGKKGYIWLGLLALKNKQKGDISFLYGIERAESEKYVIRLKAVKEQKVLDMKEWHVRSGEYAVSTEEKILEDMGLENVQLITRINFSGEACGIPTDYYYYGWTGNNFVSLPGKSSTFDAGAFNETEVILFPKEVGGQPGKIVKLKVLEEYGDDMETVVKKNTTREIYLWDGVKATKQ